MACKYYYFTGDGVPKDVTSSSVREGGEYYDRVLAVSETLEGIRDQLLNATNTDQNIESFAIKYNSSDLVYFHADTQQLILTALESAHDSYIHKPSKSSAVTSIASDYAFKDPGSSISSQSKDIPGQRNYYREAQEFEINFRREFGTFIHTGLQYSSTEDWKQNNNLKIEFNELIKKFYDLMLNPALYDVLLGLNSKLVDFIKKLYTGSEKDQIFNLYITNVLNLKAMLILNYGSTYKTEFSVANKGSAGLILTGQLDIVFVTEDNRVIIIDLKTSSSGILSNNSKIYHYLLLEMYKNILIEHGIDSDKIEYLNVFINYDSNGDFYLNVDSKGHLILENPESGMNGESRNKAYKFYQKYFKKPIVIEQEEVKLQLEKSKKKIDLIASQKLLKSYEKDTIQANIETACRNKNKYYSRDREKVVELSFKDASIKTVTLDTEIIVKDKDGEILDTITLAKFLDKEMKAIELSKEATITQIKSLLKERKLNALLTYIDYDTSKQKSFWTSLYQYMSDEMYEYVEIPFLEREFGLICMKHMKTNSYDFIKIIPNAGELDYSRNTLDHILSSVVTNPELLHKYREAKDVLRPTINNINLLQSILVINDFASIIPNFKLGNIKCVSTISGQSTPESSITLDRIGLTLKLLQQCCKEDTSLENRELFLDCYDKFTKISKANIEEILSGKVLAAINLIGYDKDLEDFRSFDWKSEASILEKINNLEKLVQVLKSDIKTKSELSGHEQGEKLKEATDYCYRLILTLLNLLIGADAKEMHRMSSYGISGKETIVHAYNLLAKGEIEEFNRNGLLITGLAQALESSIPYANPDQLNRRFHAFFDAASGLILNQLQTEIGELNTATEKFLQWGKSQKFLGIKDTLIFKHNDIYKTLLVGDNEGISKLMKFKNPYFDKTLLPEQKEYLEILLWQINRHRIPNVQLAMKYKHMSYAEFKKTDAFGNYQELLLKNDTYLEVPLKKKDGQSATFLNFNLVLHGNKTIRNFLKEEVHRMLHWMETDILNDQELQNRDTAVKKLEYYNYFKENAHNRADKTANTNVDEWELNFNRVAVEYALADIRELYFTLLLKIADRALGEIKLLEITSGKDFSKQTETLLNQIKISIYGKTLADGEWNDVLAGMGIVKQLTSYLKISVRPMLFMKEMLLGRIRNTSAILSKMVDNGDENPIKLEHLYEAGKIVFGPEFLEKTAKKLFGDLSLGSKTITDGLNDTYAINDRDLSVIGEKFAFDRNGLYNWGSRMLYLNTIAPDWFNRMIIFIAKMKADGVWDAHKYEDNMLVYDPTKDERIKEFWNNRYHPKNTAEYKKAEAFYKLKMQQFEKEGWKNSNGTELHYGLIGEDGKPMYDVFPRAYTSQEEDSIKEQIGLVYGYYSHQERANMQKGLWWTMYTQFLTFMPAEVRKYLAIGTDSSRMKTIHEIDPITKKKLYWELDPETNMHVKVDREKDEKGNYNEPVLKDIYNPYEGLLISTVKTVGQLCKGDIQSIVENPQLLRNTELFLFNTILAALIAALIGYLVNLEYQSTQTKIVEDLLSKTANELDFYHTVLLPVGNFGIVGTDFLQGTFKNVFKTIESDGYSLFNLAENTSALIGDLHLNLDI